MSVEEEIWSEGTNVPCHCKQPSKSSGASHQVHSGQYHESTPFLCEREKLSSVEVEGNTKNINCSNYEIADAQYCYYLLEAMPLPGPTWSTTSPCVLVEPPPPPPPPPPPSAQIEASLGLELGENQGPSSYSWWVGFLDGLDCNNKSNEVILHYPFVENVDVMGNSDKRIISFGSPSVDAMDLSCCSCPDDWLMVPTMEKDFGDYCYAIGK